jgi:hypothetical protein
MHKYVTAAEIDFNNVSLLKNPLRYYNDHAKIFGMQHYLVILYKNFINHTTGVKKAVLPQGTLRFTLVYIGKYI